MGVVSPTLLFISISGTIWISPPFSWSHGTNMLAKELWDSIDTLMLLGDKMWAELVALQTREIRMGKRIKRNDEKISQMLCLFRLRGGQLSCKARVRPSPVGSQWVKATLLDQGGCLVLSLSYSPGEKPSEWPQNGDETEMQVHVGQRPIRDIVHWALVHVMPDLPIGLQTEHPSLLFPMRSFFKTGLQDWRPRYWLQGSTL